MSNEQAYTQLASGFFGFWVKNWRISFLVVFLIIGLGVMSLMSIPKESTPDIKFGILSITTVYQGVNPVDMDSLITEEIEEAIKDIDGISSISSSSSVGVASTTVELENGVDINDVIAEIKDEIEKLRLPDDAEDPSVIEISSASDIMFEAILSGPASEFSRERLLGLAKIVQNELEGKNGVTDVDVGGSFAGSAVDGAGGGAGADFDLHVLVDQARAEALSLSPAQIANQIRAYNQNAPLGNFEIGGRKYDFRIDGELLGMSELLNVPLRGGENTDLRLRDVADIVREYDDSSVARLGKYGQPGNNSVSLVINKANGSNIFATSDTAKENLEEITQRPDFEGTQIDYVSDLSSDIREDYNVLARSGGQTLIFVFLCLLLFVGVKEASIATFSIPLAFLVTFIVLDRLGLSLNFLTNFSLVLTLGIAIDTTIVVIEGAYEKLKLGYKPMTAVLMAVRDFHKPLIAGTLTTLVVFIPMMVLPGITGKFLAYIPITVFVTLIAALFISLTINSALFYKLSKNPKKYIKEDKLEQFLIPSDSAILAAERGGKIEKEHGQKSFREKALDKLSRGYESTLKKLLSSKKSRLLTVFVPLIALIATFILLSPRIGFQLFPSGDEGAFFLTIETAPGTTTDATAEYIPLIENVLSDIPELDVYTLKATGNRIFGTIELTDEGERSKKGMRDVFEVESDVIEDLGFLEREGLKLEAIALAGGPPVGKPVGINLIAEQNNQFDKLVRIAKDFAAHLRTVDGTKNVNISVNDTPGQFIFEFDENRLSNLGLSPSDITGQLFTSLNGFGAGSITINKVDADIKVLYDTFSDEVTADEILNTKVQGPLGAIPVGEVMDVKLSSAVGSISRDDTDLTVRVESDLEEGYTSQGPVIQQSFIDRADSQGLPEGISFSGAGEGDENAELIQATLQGFLIALFLILVILVLQFNSFRKPTIIMYSVLLALFGVNIGLFVTGNPYSMPFAIGFIALTGIVVNDAIIFLDRITQNIAHKVGTFDAIIEAGRSRLQPIILTTLTTLLGVLPISLQDPFWEGLGFTMIFGLFAGSAMTLFVIPTLYYMVFVPKEKTPSPASAGVTGEELSTSSSSIRKRRWWQFWRRRRGI